MKCPVLSPYNMHVKHSASLVSSINLCQKKMLGNVLLEYIDLLAKVNVQFEYIGQTHLPTMLALCQHYATTKIMLA